MRASINAIAWTPDGRRCLTGTNAGEFTLWQGQHFGFETILQVTLPVTTPVLGFCTGAVSEYTHSCST